MRGIRKVAAARMVHFDAHSYTWDTYSAATNTPMHAVPRAVEEGLLDPGASSRSASAARLYKRDDNQWAVDQACG